MQAPPGIIHKRMVRHNKRQAGADPFNPGDQTGEEDEEEEDPANSATTTSTTPRAITTTRTTSTQPAVTPTTTTRAQVVTTPTTTQALVTTTESDIVETTTAVQTTAALTTTTPILPVTSLRPTTATTLARLTSSRSIATTASLTEEPTSTSTAEASKAPVGTIIGVIAGGLVGVVVVAATIGWIFRKWSRRKNDDANYRNEFMRNSVAIPDRDFAEKALKGTTTTYGNPRPPSMIERHVNQVGTGAGAADNSYQQGDVFNAHSTQSYGGYPDQAQGGAYYNNNNGYDYNSYNNAGAAAGYYDQSGQWVDYNQYPPQAGYGYTPPNESQQSELTRRPSGPGKSTYLSRQPSNGAALNVNGSEQYSRNMEFIPPAAYDEKHQSVTPYQQQQYNEIHKQLGFDSQHHVQEKQDPSGQAGGAANLGRALSTTYSSLNPQKPSPAANLDDVQVRSGTPTDPNPQQVYVPPSASGNSLHPAGRGPAGQPGQTNRHSVFDADDAYGGM